MTAHREILQALSSPLLGLEEIGELTDLTVTCQVNRNGGTHAPGCRHVSAQATEARAMTVAELRQALPECRPCSQCGGGVLGPLPDGQRERAGELIAIWRSRVEAEREKAIARRRAEDDKRRADVIDERASRIVHGWEWDIKRELPAAAGYPGGIISAPVSCLKCVASATITFEPRTLRVAFTCSRDSAHGYFTGPDDDGKPIAMWPYEELGYVACGLVAPVLAGDDDTWRRVYGTRVGEYQATAEALAAFDAANPEPVRLTLDIRCGECGSEMSAHPEHDAGVGRRIEASYACDTPHADGKFRRHDKRQVDEAIDRHLIWVLRDHPSRGVAPELEPDPEALAGYAHYLSAKMAIYDAHIGAASADKKLSELRARLSDTQDLVTTIREHGALATAFDRQPMHWRTHDWSPFSDLARALMIDHVEVTETRTTLFTRFDEGTPFYRTLRIREINEELAHLERRRQALTAELDELTSTVT